MDNTLGHVIKPGLYKVIDDKGTGYKYVMMFVGNPSKGQSKWNFVDATTGTIIWSFHPMSHYSHPQYDHPNVLNIEVEPISIIEN